MTRLHRTAATVLGLVLLLTLAAACGGGGLAPVASPAARVAHAASEGGDDLAPGPTAVATAIPRPRPVATPAPVAMLLPGPTATPVPHYRLTGLVAPDPWATYRRPLVLKIDNTPPARPQSGLQAADIVYEFVAEGGISRFSAIYQSQDAPVAGPLRSARLADLDILPSYHALFAHAGGSNEVQQRIWEAGITDIDYSVYYDRAFWRTADRVIPHNLYTDTRKLRQIAQANKWDVPVVLPSLHFQDTPPPGGGPAARVTVPISDGYVAVYTYDAPSRRYLRFMDAPTFDAATGKQVAVDNLVVQFAPHTLTDIIEDRLGSHSMEINLQGEGMARLYRDDVEIPLRWKHDGTEQPTVWLDAQGQPAAFKPGVTWIALVPPGTALDVAAS